ncbi:ciliary-associated calcium-binding coiled-coil protein 1-like [Oscarella lobularis]|uniref:ciliary-associated calcium-binding coiled-coil protein 1-like n=1 Tax=Oscarella lobularis TaxID=121494 RepID=UPI0033143D9A
MSKAKGTSRSKPKGSEPKESAKEQRANSMDREITSEIDTSLPWQLLSSSNQVHELRELDPSAMADQLAGILQLHDSQSEMSEAATLDCYVTAFYYATKEHDFSNKSTALFLSLLHRLVTRIKTIDSAATATRIVVENLKEYLPNFELFSSREQPLVLTYLNESVIQHAKLYRYLFVGQRKEENISQCLTIDQPNRRVFPLEEAMTENIWIIKEKINEPIIQNEPISEDDDKASLPPKNEEKTLKDIPDSDVRKVVATMTEKAMTQFENEMKKKLAEREATYSNRLEKGK